MTPSRPTSGSRGGGRAARVVVTLASMVGVVAACSEAGITSQPLPLAATATSVPRTLPSTTGGAVVAPDFTTFTSAGDHFSIAVPADWRQIDPSSPGMARAMADVARTNDRLAPLANVDLIAYGMRFLAVNDSGNSVYVVVKSAPQGFVESQLPQLLDEIRGQYKSRGITLHSDETVQLSGHAAIRLTLEMPRRGPNRLTKGLSEVQYFLVANDLIYAVTMAGESPDFPAIISTFTVT